MGNVGLIVGGAAALVIGLIMLIAGIVLYNNAVKANTAQQWYTYLLLIGGVIFLIGGAILLIWGLIARPSGTPPPPAQPAVVQVVEEKQPIMVPAKQADRFVCTPAA